MLVVLLSLILLLSGCQISLFSDQPSLIPPQSPPNKLDYLSQVNLGQDNYRYRLYHIKDPSKLILISNHTQKAASQDVSLEYSCSFLINGNFYDTSHQPLGWIFSQGEETSPAIDSQLFDGFFYLDQKSKPYITSSKPTNPQLGLQSGPRLISNSQTHLLSLNNDEPRRRTIVALAGQEMYFLVITNDKSFFTGPLLTKLPQIVEAIGNQENLSFKEALNLDGGTASTYLDSELHLPEANPIGSFFCETHGS